jgi:hypothetical protein
MKTFILALFLTGCLMAQSAVNGGRNFAGTVTATGGVIGTKVIDTYTAGTGGVTVNLSVSKDTSSPTRVVLPSSGGCGFGVAMATATVGNTVSIQWAGIATMVADNTVTAGHIIIGGTTTPGRGKDSGFTSRASIDSTACVIGFANTGASAGSTFTILLSGTGDYGIQTNTIDGVTVSGTPSTGQVPTATSGTTATWQTPSGGGGGGSTRIIKQVGYSNFLTNTSGTDQTHNATTLPALAAGSCYNITGSVGNDSGTNAMVFKLKIGAMSKTIHATSVGDSDPKVFRYLLCNDAGSQTTQHLERIQTGTAGDGVSAAGTENFASTVSMLITINGGGVAQNGRLQFLLIEVID